MTATGRIARGTAWGLAAAGLAVIALNPAVPSVRYAVFWLGVLIVVRAIGLLVDWASLALDLALLFVCFVGLEIGGLILVPSLVAFAIADAAGLTARARMVGGGAR